jgi:ClpP class serine protease
MSLTSVFWLFLIVVALQPVIHRRILEATRRKLIARIEKKRGSRVILLVHRQETMSILGFPLLRYIDIHDSEEVIRAIHMTDRDVPLDLVLHTPGGLVLASLQIARAIAKHPARVTVHVPHYAMSGGTLIALAADEIVMCEHAALGPVDPQLGEYPATSLLSVVERKPIAEIDDRTLIMADVAQKAVRQVRESIEDLLARSHPKERAEQLAKILSEGAWTHDHPISFDEAKELGLRVRSNVPEEFLQLMSLYPQPMRRQPSVEYLPTPRHREKPPA